MANSTKADLEKKVEKLEAENSSLKAALDKALERLTESEKNKGSKQQRTTIKTKDGSFIFIGSGINIGGRVYSANELKSNPAKVVELHKKGSGRVIKKD